MNRKSVITLTPVTNFNKLFWHNLRCHWCIALSFDSGYATRGVNYAEKSFMTLATDIKGTKVSLLFIIASAKQA
jgi:hypothetical protein